MCVRVRVCVCEVGTVIRTKAPIHIEKHTTSGPHRRCRQRGRNVPVSWMPRRNQSMYSQPTTEAMLMMARLMGSLMAHSTNTKAYT